MEAHMTFSVLGVPSSAGAFGLGCEQAPGALRRAGLVNGLRSAGVEVFDAGDGPVQRFRPDPAHRTAQGLEAVLAVAGATRSRVRDVLGEGSIPIVLGGDCTITLGVVAGVLDHHEQAALAYVDGDADLSTPVTTTSGILDAMGMAHLLDLPGASEELADLAGRRPLLDGSRVALVGLHDDLDADARRALDEQGVRRYLDHQVREAPSAVAGEIVEAFAGLPLVVHFDVDVVDSTDLPLGFYPHFNAGVDLDVATEVLGVLTAAPTLSAVVVTEVDPNRDYDGAQVGRLVRSLVDAIGGLPSSPAGSVIAARV
jgi:arginase